MVNIASSYGFRVTEPVRFLKLGVVLEPLTSGNNIIQNRQLKRWLAFEQGEQECEASY